MIPATCINMTAPEIMGKIANMSKRRTVVPVIISRAVMIVSPITSAIQTLSLAIGGSATPVAKVSFWPIAVCQKGSLQRISTLVAPS
jgi:hypothetical protein